MATKPWFGRHRTSVFFPLFPFASPLLSCWSPRTPAAIPVFPPHLLPKLSRPSARLAITVIDTPPACPRTSASPCPYTTADAAAPAGHTAPTPHTNTRRGLPRTRPWARLAPPPIHSTPGDHGSRATAWHPRRRPPHSSGGSSR